MISRPLFKKIDFYMQQHVTPFFKPEEILWCFSLSGGKDSYSMLFGVKEWYASNGYTFHQMPFHVSQWSSNAAEHIARELGGEVRILDAVSETARQLNYTRGEQAPCSDCSNIRKQANDTLVGDLLCSSDKTIFLARGLHLTDTAISFLWRKALGLEPFEEIEKLGKYKPIEKLGDRFFLVKPLSYAREFETQDFIEKLSVNTCCCGCPACFFPSRRDIIKETLTYLFSSSVWECDVQGVQSFLNKCSLRGFDFVVSRSAPGVENRAKRLSGEFYEFTLNKFYERFLTAKYKSDMFFDCNANLDEIGLDNLQGKYRCLESQGWGEPKSLTSLPIKIGALEMASVVLGPFWGAYGLGKESREKAIDLQSKMFGIKVTEKLDHVIQLLKDFNKVTGDAESNGKNFRVCSIHCNGSSVSKY